MLRLNGSTMTVRIFLLLFFAESDGLVGRLDSGEHFCWRHRCFLLLCRWRTSSRAFAA
ncbi:hypothetical protein L210DRAFT_3540581, partial [Boletus edulis BED1]